MDGSIIELWNMFTDKQTWEIEPISIVAQPVILELDKAKVNQNMVKMDPDEFLNQGKENVDHDFKFDKVLKDIYRFGNVNGFKITDSTKFKVPEIVMNDQNQPVLDDSKSSDMALGENSREIKVSLSKTMNVQPDKKIAATLKITKFEIVVPFELRINDTISGNTNSVMGTLAVTL